MIPAEGDNVVAAGRCIDADLPALSSVRVMGPCMAMGAAAAKALDLAGTGSVHQIDISALAKRVHDNVEPTTAALSLARRKASVRYMKLTDYEKAMFDGVHGRAKARAMDLLVRYGEALGAERLVETNNVAGAFNASTPSVRELVKKGFDAVYSELNLDSAEVVEVPKMVGATPASSSPASTTRTGACRASPTISPSSRSRANNSSAAAASTCSRPARPIRSATCR